MGKSHFAIIKNYFTRFHPHRHNHQDNSTANLNFGIALHQSNFVVSPLVKQPQPTFRSTFQPYHLQRSCSKTAKKSEVVLFRL